MLSHRKRERCVAISLTALAGYVDALGFIWLGGYFIAFMSGNTTRLGVGTVSPASDAGIPLALILLFVLGVMCGSLINRRVGRHRRVVIMGGVTGLLLLAACCQSLDHHIPAVICMAVAMGLENTVFERNGEVSLGVTYMTGTLVKLGQRLTALVLGEDRWGWFWYFLLWCALLFGTVLGSILYLHLGLASLWPASLFAAMVTVAVARYVAPPPTA
ncbi:YoaK family protein [Salinisphaera sp. Q1T1-3]|uniref:YoaK family protein n=1 Tax=Salinisphaera sp. Q1T1-3 TaxID=2321229 RepID=UPI000E71E26A|nr:YoaK family protein [Salinisphaera sp. Q1T1-3]RJS94834.1 DUF1275 domain-containing protein [Salinisphaera sp. Q1T1-3]